MTSSDPPNPPIYPDYCHSLSLTISRWCPLRAVDVHALRSVGMYSNGKEIYHHRNHPIKWVRLTGVIVAIDDFTTRRIFTLDDSSGMCIECSCSSPPAPPASASTTLVTTVQLPSTEMHRSSSTSTKMIGKEKAVKTPTVAEPMVPWVEVDVGTVVKVKGQVARFREEKQVEVIKMEVLRGTAAEVRCWDEVVAFRRGVLDVPWVVGREEEEVCRREKADGGGGGKGKSTRKEGGEGGGVRVGDEKGIESRLKRRDRESGDVGGESMYLESRGHRDEKKRKKEQERDRSPRKLDPANKINYPSLAVRRSAAGKYDALGI